jgi:hypothetical protein
LPEITIRPSRPGDAQAVCEIYAWHVANGPGTFDVTGPDSGQWATKSAGITARGWPFLVAERGVAVIGWLGRPLALWQRGLAVAAAGTLIAALPITDEIGFALVAAFAGSIWWQRRRAIA